MAKNKIKATWKKVWHFIWEDDSIWSWIVNIVLAFLIIKFLVYPGLGLALGTTHPVVAVVSGSMDHRSDASDYVCGYKVQNYDSSLDSFWYVCGKWYQDNGMSKEQFQDYRFKNGFNKGDIIILNRPTPDKLKVGDVLVFQTASRPDPIIHRIVAIKKIDNKYYFTTRGDHNPGSLAEEMNISEDNLIGKGLFKIPWFGWIKIGFVDGINWVLRR